MLANAIVQLQRQADHCAWLFTSHKLRIEYRIAFAIGVAFPWRLVEVHRKYEEGIVLRRMHCFSELTTLRQYIEECSKWKRQDRSLVASALPGTRMVLLPRTQEQISDEGTSIELRTLEEERRLLRERMCITRPDRIVDLPVASTPRAWKLSR